MCESSGLSGENIWELCSLAQAQPRHTTLLETQTFKGKKKKDDVCFKGVQN